MKEQFTEKEMRVAKVESLGLYVLAIMPPLTDQELAFFPRPAGVRAAGIINHPNSQSIVFRRWHFGMDTSVDRDPAFIDFALSVATNYQITNIDTAINPIENWKDSLF
jgi:hypothetical protein